MFDVQFITHSTSSVSYLDSVRIALEGGCRWVQLRMKEATAEELRATALQARQLCRLYKATFIIDDHVELAKEVGADGVHLGLKDMPIREARKQVGSGFIIGGTANTFEDIRRHVADGANYIGCGPFRFTTTKQKLSPILGLEGYRSILARMKEAKIEIPVIGIGGIERTDIPALRAVGLSGIALSGSILRADNPVEEMRLVMASSLL